MKKPEIGCLMRTERGTVMVPFSRQNVSLTPKAMRVQKLITEGKSFDEAFATADREYTSDGLTVKTSFDDVLSVLSAGPQQMGEVQL